MHHLLLTAVALVGAQAPPDPHPGDGLHFGGSWRERFERFDHARWGEGPQDGNGYFLQRGLLHGEFARGGLHAYAELQAAFVADRRGGPRPTDEDRCDLHQAYVDVRGELGGGATVDAQLGRQELAYGSSRLLSVREGPNVRLAFDGARLRFRDGEWRLDAFAVRPVATDRGAFDDEADAGQVLGGVYATLPVLTTGGLDAYCLVLDREAARYQQGTASERRWSLGSRLFGRPAPWDFDLEAVWQAGTWGNGGIAAWTVASDVGWTAPWPWSPRLGCKVDVASGDRDAGTDGLQSFHALFPRGAYFGEPALIGPENLFDVHPSLQALPVPALRVFADGDWFWRQTTADGLYGSSLQPLRPGTTSGSRFAGSQLQLGGEFTLRPGWTVTAVYAHFFSGPWLRDTGPADDVDYLSIWTTITF